MDKCRVCGNEFSNPSFGGPGIYSACDCGHPPQRLRIVEGTWPVDDLRRAFVQGAKWWEFHSSQFTMWQSDQRLAEDEAEKRYPDGKIPPGTITTKQLEQIDQARIAAEQSAAMKE